MPTWQEILAGVGGAANVAGGSAAGAAEGRIAEGNVLTNRDRNAVASYGINQQATLDAIQQVINQRNEANKLDLARRQFGLDATNTRARQAVRGDVMRNVQDVQFSGLPGRISRSMPTVTGGLRPSTLGPGSRQFGDLMTRQALAGQLKGDQFTTDEPIDSRTSGLVTPPKLSDLPQASGLDTVLGNIGRFGGIVTGGLAAYNAARNAGVGGASSISGGGAAGAAGTAATGLMGPPEGNVSQLGSDQHHLDSDNPENSWYRDPVTGDLRFFDSSDPNIGWYIDDNGDLKFTPGKGPK